MRSDEFDELALTPEQIAELAPLQKVPRSPKPRPTSRAKFVKLPYEETMRAAGQLRNTQMTVLVELAHLRFKLHRDTVPLANTALRLVGVSRPAKQRALRQLQKVGLVKVSWRGRKSPLVTLLWG
jgi:hypothetical protein